MSAFRLDRAVDALTGEVVDTRARFRCERPSKYAGFIVEGGVFVPARCGAPNKCAYCAWRTATENCALVALDAIRHGHPQVGMTLTTVDPQHDLERFRKDVEHLFKAVRHAAGGSVRYLGMVEWTTGLGAKSGGFRRVHQHLLLRDVVAGDCAALEAVAKRVWEARTGASRVEVRPLRSAAGATAYVVAHHHKREQAPPPGVNVRRLRHARKPPYFVDGVENLRQEVRAVEDVKRFQRITRRLVDWDYLDGAPDEVVERELQAASAEARKQRSGVVFVKLDRLGGIKPETVRPIKAA